MEALLRDADCKAVSGLKMGWLSCVSPLRANQHWFI